MIADKGTRKKKSIFSLPPLSGRVGGKERKRKGKLHGKSFVR